MQDWKPSEKLQSPELVEGPDSLVASACLTEASASNAAPADIQDQAPSATTAVQHEAQTKINMAGKAATEQHPDLGDRYEILEFLGAGGMGTVWKVHDKSLDETFAIKVIRPEYMTDERAVKRFEKEARGDVTIDEAIPKLSARPNTENSKQASFTREQDLQFQEAQAQEK